MKRMGVAASGCLILQRSLMLGSLLFLSMAAGAQQKQQGANDVYDGSGNQQGSVAFIDALMFLSPKGPGVDICDTLYLLFTNQTNVTYPAAGAVVDARGITTNLTCTKGTPWYESSTGYINVPSTILLPAGTITIPTTWVLPNGTRVIGEGSIDPVTLNIGVIAPQTTIQACTSSTCTAAFSTGTPMIQFGDNIHCSSGCGAITLEDVTLNGSGQAVNGILNSSAQDLSYAKNVAMYQVLGTGLQISGSAYNSGPYSNAFSTNVLRNFPLGPPPPYLGRGS
jgi:hypothetical protein